MHGCGRTRELVAGSLCLAALREAERPLPLAVGRGQQRRQDDVLNSAVCFVCEPRSAASRPRRIHRQRSSAAKDPQAALARPERFFLEPDVEW